jgi:hypothetical protein
MILDILQCVTCNENYKTTYCGPPDKVIYVNFKKRYGRSTSNANFMLHVTGKKVFDSKFAIFREVMI